MRKKIGFVAHGPASANSLLPIIKAIDSKVDIYLFAFHPFVANLWGCQKLDLTIKSLNFNGLDAVVYGTGSNNEIERNVPIEARKYGIPSISILDCFWCDRDNLTARYSNQPNYIIVPNDKSKKELDELHLIPEAKVLPLGNPHFDRLKNYKIVKGDFIDKCFDICFFSQCSNTDDYSDTNPICKEALLSLAHFRNKYPSKIKKIYVAPHPREDLFWLKKFCLENDLILTINQDNFQLMLNTGVSLGISCTLQYEAQIVGKPTIFYENQNQLFRELKNLNEIEGCTPITDFDATEKITNFLSSLIQ